MHGKSIVIRQKNVGTRWENTTIHQKNMTTYRKIMAICRGEIRVREDIAESAKNLKIGRVFTENPWATKGVTASARSVEKRHKSGEEKKEGKKCRKSKSKSIGKGIFTSMVMTSLWKVSLWANQARIFLWMLP